jgi:hypothetical protein
MIVPNPGGLNIFERPFEGVDAFLHQCVQRPCVRPLARRSVIIIVVGWLNSMTARCPFKTFKLNGLNRCPYNFFGCYFRKYV